jgi:DhnA family fructose-bisphosphate aldolase class Ia
MTTDRPTNASKYPRMNRLFGPSGNCLDVAIDHGVFNEYSFLDGLRDMAAVVGSLVAARPDAIQMNIGQADLLQSVRGKDRPALVLRVDVGNPYNPTTHKVMFDQLQDPENPILGALKLDAAMVVCNLLILPDEPDLHRQTTHNVGRLRTLCDTFGMPLMVEPLIMRTNDARGGYQVNGDASLIVPLVRQARELGADIIKVDPTDDPDDFAQVLDAARCPVLIRGGGREDLRSVFDKAAIFMAQGANGLVYGRNIYQHPNMGRVTAALLAIIHDGASGQDAWDMYDSRPAG